MEEERGGVRIEEEEEEPGGGLEFMGHLRRTLSKVEGRGKEGKLAVVLVGGSLELEGGGKQLILSPLLPPSLQTGVLCKSSVCFCSISGKTCKCGDWGVYFTAEAGDSYNKRAERRNGRISAIIGFCKGRKS